MNIPIVVAAYDRVLSLERLLSSLVGAKYEESVKLIISIDGGGASEVRHYAEHFDWPHGEKEVIVHKENLGLRKHILFCGGMAKLHDGVILLEDDLYVSPWFYQYAVTAAEFYKQNRDVAGIALYASRFNEAARLPFYPLDDGFDVYFIQLACSWGQLWLRSQWEEFEDWYDQNTVDLKNDYSLPYETRQWPESSWKKYFIKYMIEKNLYFVYPRFSLTTNFGDVGQHHLGTSLYQVPLLYGEKKEICFADFSSSFVKYDAFCEIIPESLASLCPHLDGFDFVVDLYGIKEEQCYTKQYVLTSKKCEKFAASFGRSLLPPEYNVIDDVPGNSIFLAPVENVEKVEEPDHHLYIYTRCATAAEQKYYYNISDLHYFLFQKEIKKLTSMNSMGKERNKEMRESLGKVRYQLQQRNKDFSKVRSELQQANKMIFEARKNIDSIRNSLSYRLGNKIVQPFSYIGKLIKNG